MAGFTVHSFPPEVFLKSMATGKIMEVDGADIRARSSMQGTRQRIFVGDAQMKVKVAVFKLGTSADDRLRGLNFLNFVFGERLC